MAFHEIENPAAFLLESGLLGEINRVVLHPRGLALGVGVNEGRATSCRLNRTDDPEGWDFDAAGLEDILRKLTASGLLEPLAARKAAFGFAVQPFPPPPPCTHRHPDGSDARENGVFYICWRCTLCGATDLDG
jgi:hypothetical protein